MYLIPIPNYFIYFCIQSINTMILFLIICETFTIILYKLSIKEYKVFTSSKQLIVSVGISALQTANFKARIGQPF